MHDQTKRKIFIGFILALVLMVGVGVTVYLSQQIQDPRQRADELTPTPAEGELTPTPVPACIDNEGSCEWDLLNNATSYHFKVTETDSGSVITEGDIQAPDNSVKFTIEPNKTYKCEVTATNSCGTGLPGEVTNTCTVATPTPTPIVTVPPTPTDIPTPTVTEVPTPTTVPPTPTVIPTRIPPTVIPTVPPVVIIQPTTPPVVVQQPPQTIVQQPQTVVVQQPQATPVPTLPPTGPTEVIFGLVSAVTIGIIGAVIFFIL